MQRVAFYLRVSTGGQSSEPQRLELERVADENGWQVVKIYEDGGVSGAGDAERLSALDELLADAALDKFDIVAIWSTDRLGRNEDYVVNFLSRLSATGCHLYVHQPRFFSGAGSSKGTAH